MAEIKNCISYSAESKKSIAAKEADPTFAHGDWGNGDLEELRIEVRNFYRTEQNLKCSYCKNEVAIKAAANSQIDHIVPKSKHPAFIFEPKNLCVVCADCNLAKGEKETLKQPTKVKRYPRSSKAFKIVHPHFDDYDKHILITKLGFYVDKDSDKGNFTIGACKLNRKLGALGWNPGLVSEKEVMEAIAEFTKATDSIQKAEKLKVLAEVMARVSL